MSGGNSTRNKGACIHHWDLGESRNWVVHGVCRKCGAKRDFPSDPFGERGVSSIPIATRRNRKASIDPMTLTEGNGAEDYVSR